MKIDNASYILASSHLATSRDESTESLRAWTGDRRPDFEARAHTSASAVSLSSAARAALAADLRAALAALPPPPQIAQPMPALEKAAIDEAADAVGNDPFLSLIKFMVELLTGRPIRVFSVRALQRTDATPSIADPNATSEAASPQAAPTRAAGFGLEYDFHAVHEESEDTQVSAEGTIKTADGQEIRFTIELSMTRSYREETSVSLRLGDAVRRDPLALNFSGAAAQLSDRRFAFDLSNDGTPEKLPQLASGSGYLAIDRNGNGRMDSGSELLGTATNSGFAELAALDTDANRWIDENDLAFKDLRIWTIDAQGAGRLETLARARVGAIALGQIATPFELRGADNSKLGAIAATGLFVGEDGRVGTVQEVDLSV